MKEYTALIEEFVNENETYKFYESNVHYFLEVMKSENIYDINGASFEDFLKVLKI